MPATSLEHEGRAYLERGHIDLFLGGDGHQYKALYVNESPFGQRIEWYRVELDEWPCGAAEVIR